MQVATYRNQRGKDVAQHLRYPDKKFRWIGDTSDIQLWGQHLWRQNHGKETDIFCVITEGEVDAMSVSQVQGNRFPVVSLPNGAQSASKYIAANIAWLRQFRIVLCFDSDEPGTKAAEEAIKVLPYGRAAICRLPRKDANDMLQAGEGAQLKDLLWKATPVDPTASSTPLICTKRWSSRAPPRRATCHGHSSTAACVVLEKARC